MGREGWAAAIIGSVGQDWDVERRFRVTEVALAIMWVCGFYRRSSDGGVNANLCSAVHLHIFLTFLLIV